jgi:large subunit ribosomal protein L16
LVSGRFKGNATRGTQLAFGDFGVKALEPKFITARQIEACRVPITRKMQRQGQVWIRIFPDRPLTKKPAEVRMGSGKGAIEKWAAPVLPGTILFEISGVSRQVAMDALRLAQFKLPIKTKIVVRRDYQG